MPFCSNCGNQVAAGVAACPSCGHPQQATAAAAPYGRRTEGSAIVALVLGIAGIVVCPVILSIPAIIVGNQAKARIASDPTLDGEGLANAGVIPGWVGIGIVGATMLIGAFMFMVSGIF